MQHLKRLFIKPVVASNTYPRFRSCPMTQRGFANINYDAIVPQNSVTKVYQDLVEQGQIRADPKQQAVIGMLEQWQKKFVAHEPRIFDFQEEYSKVANFGQNAKKLGKKGAGKFHQYNTEMHTTMGKRDLDPQQKARNKVIDMFSDLNDVELVYVWGDPGSGKSFLTELLYHSLDLEGEKKKKQHYNEFMLQIHEMEHKINKKMKGRVGETIAIVGNEFSLGTTFFFIDEF